MSRHVRFGFSIDFRNPKIFQQTPVDYYAEMLDFIAWAEKGLGEHDHHLVRAVSDDKVLGLHGPVNRQFFPQESAAAVGIEVADL